VNTSDFPNLAGWATYFASQSRGAIMIALIVLAGLAWLLMARFTWPKLLPLVRVSLVGAFYVSLGVLIYLGVRSV